MRIPPLEPAARVVTALREAGLAPAVGGSGLLVALGLAEVANDWDVTVDADAETVTTALDAAGLSYRPLDQGRYAIGEVDLMVDFALPGPAGVEALPTRVTGEWQGLPIGDPEVWARAYRLLGRDAKADLLERYLEAREHQI
ncbi:hypothetical protein [Prauserella flavalba]|uniref:Uncharacterized protein n=1 Tax=Prauserella flavalba TaxID=1477506 RepID=A0A318LAL5_9PSEU|nr:hypothetical protein [Prauserella flavalba]PXY18568.1 hypothetical protein BA062_35175 [Prauserella flavalba]